MMMFWNIRRRPSRTVELLRSALLIGAAVSVPVGFEILRRLILREKPFLRKGRGIVQRTERIARDLLTNGGSRRRRAMASTRS